MIRISRLLGSSSNIELEPKSIIKDIENYQIKAQSLKLM